MAEKITGVYDNKLTLSAFVIVVLFLGVHFVAVKFSHQELQPFWGASLRFIMASVLLFGSARIRDIALPKRRALIGAGLFGLFSFAINFGGSHATFRPIQKR
jgi:drug/metabolite transporter (DMT)-like permease